MRCYSVHWKASILCVLGSVCVAAVGRASVFCFPVSEAAKVSRAVARWNSLSFVYQDQPMTLTTDIMYIHPYMQTSMQGLSFSTPAGSPLPCEQNSTFSPNGSSSWAIGPPVRHA